MAQIPENSGKKTRVMIEINPRDHHLIKKVKIVEGRWLTWAVEVMKKILTPRKVFHFNKAAIYHDLTKFVDDMSHEFEKVGMDSELDETYKEMLEKDLETLSDVIAKVSERFFAKDFKKQRNLLARVEGLKETCTFAEQQLEMILAIKELEDLVGEEFVQKAVEICEKRDSIIGGYKVSDVIKSNVQKLIDESGVNNKIIVMALKSDIDLSPLTKVLDPRNPLCAKLQTVEKIRELDRLLDKLETTEDPIEFMKVGADYIDIRKNLTSEETDFFPGPVGSLDERFKAIDFNTRAMEHVKGFQAAIDSFTTETDPAQLNKFKENFLKHQERIQILSALTKKLFGSDEHDTLRLRIWGVINTGEVKLKNVCISQFESLGDHYAIESTSTSEKITQLNKSNKVLMQSIKEERTREEISEGKKRKIIRSKHLPSQLTCSEESLDEEDRNFIKALNALVQMVQYGPGESLKIREERVRAWNSMLLGAGFVIPRSITAEQFLMDPVIREKVSALLHKLESLKEKDVIKLGVQTEKALPDRKELMSTSVLDHEIPCLRYVLGLTKVNPSSQKQNETEVNFNRSFTIEDFKKVFIGVPDDEIEKKAEQYLKNLSRRVSVLDVRKMIRRRYVKVMEEFETEQPDKNNYLLLYALVADMLERRDRLFVYEWMKNRDLHKASSFELKKQLEIIKKRFKIEIDDAPTFDDIMQAAPKLDPEVAQRLSLEQHDILMLGRAYKLIKSIEDSELRSDELHAEQESLDHLMEGLKQLMVAEQSHRLGEEVTDGIRSKGQKIEKNKGSIKDLGSRLQSIEEQKGRLEKQSIQLKDMKTAGEVFSILADHIKFFAPEPSKT